MLLQNPVQGGNYVCSVPPQAADRACLHGDSSGHGKATVSVDRVEARLSVLEKENQLLKLQQTQTETELSDTKAELASLNQTSSARLDKIEGENKIAHIRAELTCNWLNHYF